MHMSMFIFDFEIDSFYFPSVHFYVFLCAYSLISLFEGGIAPNRAGRVSPFASKLTYSWEAKKHRVVTDAVHYHDAKICMQILVLCWQYMHLINDFLSVFLSELFFITFLCLSFQS